MEPAASSNLLGAVDAWAKRHPRGDTPVLRIVGKSQRLSPLEIARHIREETPTGKLLRRVLSHAAEKQSIEDIIASFEIAAPLVVRGGAGTAH